jgi:small subunit ribosomal protein S9
MMKVISTSGKRKRAIARAVLKKGKGIIRINKNPIDYYNPGIARLKLKEPLFIAGDTINKVNIDVNVFGGGIMSQAEASRLAIARAIVQYDKKLEKLFLDYDRHLLVADVRRKEAAKPNRHGQARAKKAKSYR